MNNTKFLNLINPALSYEDILLRPQYSNVSSRNEPSLSFDSGSFKFKLPLISSPMDTVTEAEMAYAMLKAGGFGIIHRACTIKKQTSIVIQYKELAKIYEDDSNIPIAAAVGVSGDYQERINALVDVGVNILCFDTSHGHNKLMRDALTWTKTNHPTVYLIAGSIATAEGYAFLANNGADAVRVGVGNGSICSTRLNTGFGVPQVSALLEIAKAKVQEGLTINAQRISINRDAAVIADGGCRHPGDIVKALALGANFVMLGSLLAGTFQAPGETFDIEGVPYKAYRGMASKEAQEAFNKVKTSIEGVATTIPLKGCVLNILKDYEMNIKAALSYAGCFNLEQFRSDFYGPSVMRVSSLSNRESDTHIFF